ncbi:MAG: hypothetical protein NTY19_50145 [Planctomycetota bacterium]|nr:hypothetical protein [Planctomycetota bacterium]
MNSLTSRPRSCDPQLLEATPQEDWGVEDLGQYAQGQHQAIQKGEQSLAVHYWHLGLALDLARRHFARHQWGMFLEELGIDKTRASKARALHRTFPTEQAVEGLSVQDAYARRERKPHGPSSEKRRQKQKQQGLFDWLLDVCKKADLFLDEAGFADPSESSTLLPAVDAAIDELTKLRARLQKLTGA